MVYITLFLHQNLLRSPNDHFLSSGQMDHSFGNCTEESVYLGTKCCHIWSCSRCCKATFVQQYARCIPYDKWLCTHPAISFACSSSMGSHISSHSPGIWRRIFCKLTRPCGCPVELALAVQNTTEVHYPSVCHKMSTQTVRSNCRKILLSFIFYKTATKKHLQTKV